MGPFKKMKNSMLRNYLFAAIYKILHNANMIAPKLVEFRGCSRDDLHAFPFSARCEVGHQLDLVQNRLEPDDWNPMNTANRT